MAKRPNSATKGFAFEREICKRLSLWWTDGERDDVFWRTSGSGARATTRMKQGKRTHGQYGDVCAVDPIGEPLMTRVLIEIKRGYQFNPLDFLDPKRDLHKHPVWKWMSKVYRETRTSGREDPWIIYKADRKPVLIMVPKKASRGGYPILEIGFWQILSLDVWFEYMNPLWFGKEKM